MYQNGGQTCREPILKVSWCRHSRLEYYHSIRKRISIYKTGKVETGAKRPYVVLKNKKTSFEKQILKIKSAITLDKRNISHSAHHQ